MAISQYQLISQQAQRLAPQEQLRLIQDLVTQLAGQLAGQSAQRIIEPRQPRQLIYGEFRNTPEREFSTEDDFKLAEWHPTEEQLNGD